MRASHLILVAAAFLGALLALQLTWLPGVVRSYGGLCFVLALVVTAFAFHVGPFDRRRAEFTGSHPNRRRTDTAR